MRKINKKVSAMVLAGMIISGGFISSGIGANAMSVFRGSINQSNQDIKSDYEFVKMLSKEFRFKILLAQKGNREDADVVIKNKFKQENIKYSLLKYVSRFKYKDELYAYVKGSHGGRSIVRFRLNNLDFVIQFKK